MNNLSLFLPVPQPHPDLYPHTKYIQESFDKGTTTKNNDEAREIVINYAEYTAMRERRLSEILSMIGIPDEQKKALIAALVYSSGNNKDREDNRNASSSNPETHGIGPVTSGEGV